jgi:hypothetical protein
MGVSTWLRNNFTTQDPTTYKSTLDGNAAVLERLSAYFAPSQSSTPNMTVTIRPGSVFAASSLTEVAQQITTAFTAPATNPRIDRIVLDQVTGIYYVVAGTPAVGPVAPAIPAGKIPCCQILFQTTSTTITNSMITDERVPALFVDLAASIHAATSKVTPVSADELAIVDSAAGNILKKLTFTNLAAWISSSVNAFTATTATTANSLAPCSFSVHKNGTSQTINSGSVTQITWPTELFDTNSNFSGNVFTPTIAGKYLLTLVVYINSTVNALVFPMTIRKNGAFYAQMNHATVGTLGQAMSFSVVVDANGSTDYFDTTLQNSDSSNRDINGGSGITFFCGCRVG